MEEKAVDGFSNLHPFSNFIFLLLEFCVIMFAGNPFLQGIGAVCAFFYLIFLKGKQAFRGFFMGVVAALIAALINPLFSHEGATILTYFWDDNPLTLESVLYGLGMGIMLFAGILWFMVLNEVMTTEKWIHLFGKVIPSVGLLFSMVLRFIPKLQNQKKTMREVNPEAKRTTLFSMLLTWGLETSVDTADSMSARGYGLGNRSSYSIYHISNRDIFMIGSSFVLAGFTIGCLFTEQMDFYYYPVILIKNRQPFAWMGYIAFGVFSLLPLLFGIRENIKWNYLKSKI